MSPPSAEPASPLPAPGPEKTRPIVSPQGPTSTTTHTDQPRPDSVSESPLNTASLHPPGSLGRSQSPNPGHLSAEQLQHDATPRSIRVSTQGTNATHKRKKYYTRIANEEMAKHWAFINDVNLWFAACIPGGNIPADILADAGNFSLVPYGDQSGIKEWDYYAELCKVSNRLFDRCGGKYTMQVTGFNPEDGSESDMKPDLCIYEKGDEGKRSYELKPKKKKIIRSGTAAAASELSNSIDDGEGRPDTLTPPGANAPSAPVTNAPSAPVTNGPPAPVTNATPPSTLDTIRPYQARVAWAWATSVIEVKRDENRVPYDVRDDVFTLLDTDLSRNTRSQVIKYASEVFLRQPRQFVFIAMIVKRRAFLMRWDRAGALVAPPFDYINEPGKLLLFLYRIAVADRSAQGYDPTVSLASAEEIRLFEEYRDSATQEGSTLREYVDKILSPKRGLQYYPIYKIICPNADYLHPHEGAAEEAGTSTASGTSERTFTFLVGTPRHATRSPTGRGGKGYVAYDLDRNKCAFLKDYWYALSETVHPETEVYQRLRAHQVSNIATLVAGGDVGHSSALQLQETITQDYLPIEGRPAKRRHHRFVVEEVGRPLETYRTDRQLHKIVSHALIAHREAWEKARVLHRDVSMGNILIDLNTGRGFLNDWDLCKYREELGRPASQHARSGTWPFMSATLLTFPRKPNELADDLESFIYVISMTLTRFHQHQYTLPTPSLQINEKLSQHVHKTYHVALRTVDEYWVGDDTKLLDIRKGESPLRLADPNSNLAVLLRELFKLGRDHYSTLDLDQLQARWGAGSLIERLDDDNENEKQGGDDKDGSDDFSEEDSEDDKISWGNMVPNYMRIKPLVFPPPSTPSSSSQQPTRDLNSHNHIMEVFAIVDDMRWKKAGRSKIEDQFTGIQPFILDASSTAGTKRKSLVDSSGTKSKKANLGKLASKPSITASTPSLSALPTVHEYE